MLEQPILWRVNGWGRQLVGSERKYWWENQGRLPLEQVYLQLTIEGSIVLQDHLGTHTVGPGQFILFKHGEATAYGRPEGDATPYRCEWLGLLGAGLYEHWSWAQERYGSVHRPRPEEGERLRAAMNRLMDLHQPSTRLSPVAAAAAVQRFVAELFTALEEAGRSERKPAVEQAIDHLVSHPLHGGTLKQIAHHYGVSREHLARAFQARLGQWPAAWLTQARLEKALQLLRYTDLPMDDVAEQSGFPSAHTLARQVRRATGKPPSAHR
jgi:AraC-like DNA-binding protein